MIQFILNLNLKEDTFLSIKIKHDKYGIGQLKINYNINPSEIFSLLKEK